MQGPLSASGGKGLGYMGMLSHIAKTEGLGSLFLRGMTPSMIREMTYSSVRMGLYEPIRNAISPEGRTFSKFVLSYCFLAMSLSAKILAGFLSGALGSAFVNPADLIKVRILTNCFSTF